MFLRIFILILFPSIIFASETKLSVEHPDFLKDSSPLRLPDLSFSPKLPNSNYWIDSMNNDIHMPTYEGIRRVVYRIVDKCFSRLYREALSSTLEQRDIYLPSELSELALRPSSYYPWWKRSVFDSLTVAQGGSQLKHYVVGAQIQVFSIGSLSVYNDGKLRVSGWDVRLSHDSEKAWSQSAPYVDLDSTQKLFRLDIRRPYSKNKKFWKVSSDLNLSIKLRSLDNNRSSVKASMRLQCKYASIRIGASYMPFLNVATAKVSVVLLAF